MVRGSENSAIIWLNRLEIFVSFISVYRDEIQNRSLMFFFFEIYLSFGVLAIRRRGFVSSILVMLFLFHQQCAFVVLRGL